MDLNNIDEDFILGETNEEFFCYDEEDSRIIALAMMQQAEFYIDILSHYFDPAIYDNETCFDILETLALTNQHARIRILLFEPRIAAQRGHYIMHLARRLGSLMELREMSDRHKHIVESFLIVDKLGVMFRSSQEGKETQVNFHDHPTAKALTLKFEKLWNDAEPSPEAQHLIV